MSAAWKKNENRTSITGVCIQKIVETSNFIESPVLSIWDCVAINFQTITAVQFSEKSNLNDDWMHLLRVVPY